MGRETPVAVTATAEAVAAAAGIVSMATTPSRKTPAADTKVTPRRSSTKRTPKSSSRRRTSVRGGRLPACLRVLAAQLLFLCFMGCVAHIQAYDIFIWSPATHAGSRSMSETPGSQNYVRRQHRLVKSQIWGLFVTEKKAPRMKMKVFYEYMHSTPLPSVGGVVVGGLCPVSGRCRLCNPVQT